MEEHRTPVTGKRVGAGEDLVVGPASIENPSGSE